MSDRQTKEVLKSNNVASCIAIGVFSFARSNTIVIDDGTMLWDYYVGIGWL